MKKCALTQKNVLNMASNDSRIDKPKCGRPERAELPDVNINTGVQSINTERTSMSEVHGIRGDDAGWML